VIFQDGDFYGRTVNMASRVCDRAAPGQVLVTERVVHLCAEDPSDGIRFEELGPTRLKGVTGPAVLFQAVAG
jgi:class 3 adenylate cyclase